MDVSDLDSEIQFTDEDEPVVRSKKNIKRRQVIDDDDEDDIEWASDAFNDPITSKPPTPTPSAKSDEDEVMPDLNPQNMTRRQRSRYLEGYDEELHQLEQPTKKTKKVDDGLRQSEVARKREMQRKQRLEQTQKDTIHKLLNKQASRKTRKEEEMEALAQQVQIEPVPDKFRYRYTVEGTLLSVPEGKHLTPLGNPVPYPPTTKPTCAICSAPSKYTCSKSLRAVCSLSHYKLIQ